MINLKRYLFSIIPALLMAWCLWGCVSLSSHQTGRTLGEGNSAVFGGFNAGVLASDQYKLIDSLGSFYFAEAGIWNGISDKFDLAAKVNSSSFITGCSKYQFLGNKESFFASSLGADLGMSPFAIPYGAVTYSASLVSYSSIHPASWVALTFAPRITHFGITNFTQEYGFTDKSNIVGYTAGIIVGRRTQLSVEVSQFVNNTSFSFNTKPIFSIALLRNLPLARDRNFSRIQP
jgi:hypothetical protein